MSSEKNFWACNLDEVIEGKRNSFEIMAGALDRCRSDCMIIADKLVKRRVLRMIEAAEEEQKEKKHRLEELVRLRNEHDVRTTDQFLPLAISIGSIDQVPKRMGNIVLEIRSSLVKPTIWLN